jgi:dipeptidyl-peptidase-3
MYLCFENEILEIFGHNNDDVSYVNWLSELRAGLMGLKYYHPETDKWGQAHMQARYVILKVCLETGNDLIQIIEDNDSNDKIYIKLNRDKIKSVGISAIGKFLEKLQEYKSTANSTEGKAFFKKYSEVDDKMMKLREIIIETTKPRPLMVQPNLILKSNDIIMQTYENSYVGLIKSFIDRFSSKDYDILNLWNKESSMH